MRRLIVTAVFLICCAIKGQSAGYRVDQSGVILFDYNTKELQEMFDDLAYDTYINLPDNEYPRVFVQNIPSDFALMQDSTVRNRLFMQILIPLILRVNDAILEERETVDALGYDFEQNRDFDAADMYYLDRLAQKYDVSTPFKDTRKYMKILEVLKDRVDVVPPSIILAAAAVRSNWGTSRIAVEANNLFKSRVWYQDEGLIPRGDEREGYKYKIYDNLEDSIKDYVLRLNSHINFEAFRNLRAVSRKRGGTLYGKRMDWSLVLDSNLQNYAGLIDYTLTYYKLHLVDGAHLEEFYDFGEK